MFYEMGGIGPGVGGLYCSSVYHRPAVDLRFRVEWRGVGEVNFSSNG